MSDWLIDTALWTGALIALVLLLRRPVARHFGPAFAYALWILPALRLVLPPLVLPAWMAPQPEVAVQAEVAFAASEVVAVAPADESLMAAVPDPGFALALDTPWLREVALAIWLGGAALFLLHRFNSYGRMREELLAEARDMGRVGNVRLVESPATAAPLAFGVIDKVIALPPGFLALHDREMRDLAMSHELAHHRGHDLLVNMLVQPLFALHWFNPLSHYGWQALRRDQEAACDARVVAERPHAKRVTYARTIASFAAGPHLALAAPMACPVLGEKSIIERLRSLNMSDHSPRRRIAGRALIGAALVALPLTASITYAETQSVDEAFAGELAEPSAPPAPPAPPEAPVPSEAPPAPPLAPEAPPAPLPPEVDVRVEIEGDHVWHSIEEEVEGEGKTKRVKKLHMVKVGEHMSDEERRKIEIEVRKALADSKQARAEARREVRIALREMPDAHALTEEALREVKLELESMEGQRTLVEMTCDGDEPASHKTRSDGTNVVMICKSKIMAEALSGLKEARAEIAQDKELDDATRKQILRSLDEQISKWKTT